MKIPSHLRYTPEHLWVYEDPSGSWLAGVTDFAQDMLGDIVYIEPPRLGSHLINGKPCGIIESVKTGSDLHAPMNGTVTEVNEALLNSPEAVNDKPYESWIFKFTISDTSSQNHLLSAEDYKKFIDNE